MSDTDAFTTLVVLGLDMTVTRMQQSAILLDKDISLNFKRRSLDMVSGDYGLMHLYLIIYDLSTNRTDWQLPQEAVLQHDPRSSLDEHLALQAPA